MKQFTRTPKLNIALNDPEMEWVDRLASDSIFGKRSPMIRMLIIKALLQAFPKEHAAIKEAFCPPPSARSIQSGTSVDARLHAHWHQVMVEMNLQGERK